jgi:hypothetical protein
LLLFLLIENAPISSIAAAVEPWLLSQYFISHGSTTGKGLIGLAPAASAA